MPANNLGRRGSGNNYNRNKPRNDGRISSGGGNQRRGGPGGDRQRNNNQSFRNTSGNSMEFGRSNRPIVSPWESGVTPGMQPGLLSSYAQPTSLMAMPQMNRVTPTGFDSNFGSFGSPPSKMRRLERGPMGSFDDHRGRGLLPSPPSAPLLGLAPSSYANPTNEPYVRQRLGSFWNPQFPTGSGSGYYPSDRQARNNLNRRQRPTNINKSRRPQQKSPTHKGGNVQDSRNRVRTNRTKKDNNRSKSPESSKDIKEEPKKSSTKVERSRDKDDEIDDPSAELEDNEKMEEETVVSIKEDKVKVEETDEDKHDDKPEDKHDHEKNKEDKESSKNKEDNFPPKALYCHICDLDSFSSRKGYVRHLQGLTHSKMSELFHAKNAATLELLNISAKLADMRQRDKVLRRTGKRNLPVMKTTEQLLVQKWLRVGNCCGLKFKSPFELEEHKLSLNHLKAKFESLPEQKENSEIKEEIKKDMGKDSKEAFIEAFDLIEEAKKKGEENPLSMENIPTYDPSKPFGLEYLRQQMYYVCKLCQGQAFHNLDGHCQSHKHYTNIVDSLNKREDTRREKKRLEEEKEKDAKRAAEKKAEMALKLLEEEKLKSEIAKEDEVDVKDASGAVDDEDDEEMEDEGEVDDEVDAEEDVEVEEEVEPDELEAAITEAESPSLEKQNGDDVEMKDDTVENLFSEIGEGIDFDAVEELENQITADDEQNDDDRDSAPKRTYSGRRRGRGRRSK